MKRNENEKTEGNILSICYTTYRSSNDRKATVQRCFERSPRGREKRKLRRCQRTKDSKCTHILLVRTSNPSSLFYLFSPYFSLYLSLSLSILCFRSFTCTVILFQFPGFASKGAFVAALLFANLRRVYTSGFPLERSSPSYVLLYIRHYTRIELSIYLSIYLYPYIYVLLQRYVYI